LKRLFCLLGVWLDRNRAASLDVAVIKKVLRSSEITDVKQILVAIVSMLVGLIKSVAPDRAYQNHATRSEARQVRDIDSMLLGSLFSRLPFKLALTLARAPQ
jgi:hypothetical protein